jgi:glycosyltransferase involved in cell wall biosynthesis
MPDSGDKKLKILFASPDASLKVVSKTPIGSAVVIESLEPELAAYGYQAEYWSPEAEGPLQFVRNIPRLVHRVHQSDADLIHLFLMVPSLTWISHLVAWRSQVPVLTTFSTHCHDGVSWLLNQIRRVPTELPWYLFKYFAYHPLWVKAARHLGGKSVYSVGSKFQAEQLKQLGFEDSKVVVVPNMTDKLRCRSFRPQPSESFRIGFMGHFTPAKGWDILLEAFERVADNIKDAELVLAWSGRGKSSLVQSAIQASRFRDRINLVGVVDPLEFLSQLAVLVQPYRHLIGTQLYPNTLLEAITVGVPVITVNLRPLDELLADGAACLVEPLNVPELAVAIVKLYDNENLRKNQLTVQKALTHKYSAPTVAQAYHNIYRKLIYEE